MKHPRSLHIEFRGREEFLARLGAVLLALENDTDKVLEFVEKGAHELPELATNPSRTES